MFWKRDDDLGLGSDLHLPDDPGPSNSLAADTMGMPPAPQIPRPEPRIESFEGARPAPYQAPQQPYYGANKDLELVSAKLDALKATLDTMNQRLANLERVAYGDDQSNRRGW